MTINTVFGEDGPWWIRCRDKVCGHSWAILFTRPESVVMERNPQNKHRMDFIFESDLECARCHGHVELYRVQIKGTVEI